MGAYGGSELGYTRDPGGRDHRLAFRKGNMSDRQSRPCRVCGSTEYVPFAEKNGFHLDRCTQCTLVQVTDDLSQVDFERLYDQGFFDGVYSSKSSFGLRSLGRALLGRHDLKTSSGQAKEYAKFRYRIDEIEKLTRAKGKILDVGCSFGFFLDVARARGWEVEGVEIGDYAAAQARDELGLQVRVGDVLDLELPENHYDVITLWNVIEHVDDPIANCTRFHSALRKGGLFVFTTPNVDCYLRKLQGMRWRAFVPPIHLMNFGPRSIGALMDRTGFRIVRRSVPLPRESLLKRLGIIGFLKAIGFSDKMMVFAEKV